MKKEKRQVSIVRSSAAEYLTFVASTGDSEDSVEMRYEDENIWLTQKMMATLYNGTVTCDRASLHVFGELGFPDVDVDDNVVVKCHLYRKIPS